MRDQLSLGAFGAGAEALGCDLATVMAVAEVEGGPWGAFLPSGEPVILFERHLFARFTGDRFRAEAPDLCNRKPGGYGLASEQHARLARAVALDRSAALRSTSWGLFQILGENWQACRARSLQDFINRVYRSADDHLALFVGFVKGQPQMAAALRRRDWARFAEMYNGPESVGYDVRLAQAYNSANHRRP